MVRIHDQQFAMLFRQEASLIEVNQRGMIIFTDSSTYRLSQIYRAGFRVFDGCELIRTAI